MVHEADSRNQSSATEKKEINPQLDPILGGTNILHSKFSRGVRSFKPSDEIKLLGKKLIKFYRFAFIETKIEPNAGKTMFL